MEAQRAAFSRALSDAIAASGLTLDEISSQLTAAGARTSVATLSYWQNGHAMPTRRRSVAALPLLEDVLGLPRGSLTSILDRDAPLEWGMPLDKPREMDLAAILAKWRLSIGDMHSHRVLQQRWTVSGDGRAVVERSRAVTRVEAEHQSAYPIVLQDGDPGNPPPQLRCLVGASLGRSLRDDERGVLVGEVLLPRRFDRGDLYWTEIEIDWGIGQWERHFVSCGLAQTIPLLTMDVVFEGNAPEVVHFSHTPIEVDDKRELDAIEVIDGRAQVVLTNPNAGLYSFDW